VGALALTTLALGAAAALGSEAWAFGPVAPAPAAPAAPASSGPPPAAGKATPALPAPAPASAGAATPATRAAPPTPAAAAPSPASPPTPARLAEARLHFQQGVALFREQNYDAALAEFQGAYGISNEPIVLYNLGLTYKALFRYSEAIETLERYVAESAAKGHPVGKDRRAEVETIVGEMRSLLADVTLVLTPPDAAVRVDGRAVVLGVDGVVKLPAGSHVIEANAADYMAARREITVVAGTPQTVPLALAAIPRTGSVTITASQIGAHIIVDGKDVGPAPVTLELGAGGHQLEVTAPGYAPGRSEVAVAAGQSRTVNIVLELPPEARMPAPFYQKWWFWAGVGGVAAVTAGTILLWPEQKQGPLSGTLGTANTAATSP